jgi:hypothetical protein
MIKDSSLPSGAICFSAELCFFFFPRAPSPLNLREQFISGRCHSTPWWQYFYLLVGLMTPSATPDGVAIQAMDATVAS